MEKTLEAMVKLVISVTLGAACGALAVATTCAVFWLGATVAGVRPDVVAAIGLALPSFPRGAEKPPEQQDAVKAGIGAGRIVLRAAQVAAAVYLLSLAGFPVVPA